MTDPRRPEQTRPAQLGSGPTQPLGYRYPPHTDPAYAGQSPYAPTYAYPLGPPPPPGSNPTEPNPTGQLPQYWPQGQPPTGQLPQGQPPTGEPAGPQRPKSPRWLWIAAAAAVVLVVALVIALVINNGSAKNQTAVPPLSTVPGSSSPGPTTGTTAPTNTTSPTETSPAGAMQTVVYSITGDGRAISITYRDNGDVIQTEFNVALPWTKEVSLANSADHPAMVTIINIGHDVTCTLTVAGVQVSQRTGTGLTVCDANS